MMLCTCVYVCVACSPSPGTSGSPFLSEWATIDHFHSCVHQQQPWSNWRVLPCQNCLQLVQLFIPIYFEHLHFYNELFTIVTRYLYRLVWVQSLICWYALSRVYWKTQMLSFCHPARSLWSWALWLHALVMIMSSYAGICELHHVLSMCMHVQHAWMDLCRYAVVYAGMIDTVIKSNGIIPILYLHAVRYKHTMAHTLYSRLT